MSLQARTATDASGNITIYVEGGMDFENSVPFRQELLKIRQKNPRAQIILDLYRLDFVGSSGIGHFAETLQILGGVGLPVKMANIKPEFLKVFKLYNPQALQDLVIAFDNDETEDLASNFHNRTYTFEN